ncbi:COBA1 protein, partial [Upupa epops]|nr:COBA1 protein [Upupa epops]
QLGHSPLFFFQHLIYHSNHLNYTAVWALLDTLSQEVQALIQHPNGTETNPATTCKELLLSHPGLPDG